MGQRLDIDCAPPEGIVADESVQIPLDPHGVVGGRERDHDGQAQCLCLKLQPRMEASQEGAARRALAIGANSYRSIESILNHRLDEHPPEPIEPAAPIEHHNIRGSHYYS